METNSSTPNSSVKSTKTPRVITLRKYHGEVKCYPNFQSFLLFVAYLDDGNVKEVKVKPRGIIEGNKSLSPWERDLNRQAEYLVPAEEWKHLENRYGRGGGTAVK